MPLTRIQTLAAAVPADARCVVDVGHDHGLLPAALLRQRPGLRVVAVERRAGADADFAARFGAEAGRWRGRLSLRRGDGLEPLGPGEADVAVVAGIGEDAILGMLDRGAALGRLPARLVLSPAGFEVRLRPGLVERGWRFASERLVQEAGRFHEVLGLARTGVEPVGEVEARWGPLLLRGPDPLLGAFLDDTKRRQRAAVARALDGDSRSPLTAKLALLPAVRSRIA